MESFDLSALHSAGIRTLVTEMSLSCPSWWMEDNWVKYIGSAPITNHTHQQTRAQPPAWPAGWSWMQICRVLPSAQIISSIFIIIYIEHLQEIYIYIMYSILYIYIILGHGTWYIHRYFWQGSK